MVTQLSLLYYISNLITYRVLLATRGPVQVCFTFNENETLPRLALWLVGSLQQANQSAKRHWRVDHVTNRTKPSKC